MRIAMGGLAFALVIAFSATTLAASKSSKQQAGSAASGESAGAAAGGEEKTPALSKEEQAKLREHMKMRNFIAKDVKYPATKTEIMNKVKKTSIKADDRKWLEQTIPDKTYSSAEEVYQSLGWDVQAPSSK